MGVRNVRYTKHAIMRKLERDIPDDKISELPATKVAGVLVFV